MDFLHFAHKYSDFPESKCERKKNCQVIIFSFFSFFVMSDPESSDSGKNAFIKKYSLIKFVAMMIK